MAGTKSSPERIIGRYALHQEIASGGMATVHLGRLLGQVGFSRTVAIKRMYPQFAKEPEVATMFLDEAWLAGRIQHPNVVSTLDVVATEGELFLVMEYVHGESFARLLRRQLASDERIPAAIVSSIVCGALHGLHAAHEAKGERGEPLGIVHRDVSPHNIMVGIDGVPRVFDFGIAKAVGRLQTTREGHVKGKLAYMAPEQLHGVTLDRRADVYSAAVVLWEALAGRALYHRDNEGAVITQVLAGAKEPPSRYRPELSRDVDAVVMRGLALDPNGRWQTGRDLAVALESVLGIASPREVGEWVERMAGPSLSARRRLVEDIESNSAALASAPSIPPSAALSGTPSFPPPDPSSRLTSTGEFTPHRGSRLTTRHATVAVTVGVVALVGMVAIALWITEVDPPGRPGADVGSQFDDARSGPPDAGASGSGGTLASSGEPADASPAASTSSTPTASQAKAPTPRSTSSRKPGRPASAGTAAPVVKFEEPD